MSSSAPVTPSSPLGRLIGVAIVVFLANAGLLVLQLVAGRLLSPFIGSSLETWTAVIAAFLAGIALGNAVGGRIADRSPSTMKLSLFLGLGALGGMWMIAFPEILSATAVHKSLDLTVRIPILCAVLCFPVAFVLSLITPLAIRLGVPDVGRTGAVAGMIFSMSTLGCLLGNYLTGFVLIPQFTINTIVGVVVALYVLTGLAVLVIFRQTQETGPVQPAVPAESIEAADEVSPRPVLPMAYAVIIVFFCSFAGMTLELSSTRLLAQLVGVSIFTWTGVIGVMLAGTALGNWIGGIIADYANTRWETRTLRLASLMILAGVTAVLSLVIFTIITRTHNPFASFGLIGQIIALTFSMFFLPMFFLGTISPQVIRLVVPDVSVAGRVAGRIYAWSTAGAIAGTFTTGYFLISHVGVYYTVLICAVFPIAAVTLIQGAFKNSLLLYGASAALGIVVGGFILRYDMQSGITLETNYYTIKVQKQQRPAIGKIGEDWEAFGAIAGPVAVVEEHLYAQLVLDFLVHSIVDLSDPEYLYYKHEQIQVEMVRHFRDRHPEEQRILVVGGGGYTFPRCVRSRIPTTQVDVVEIDPGVTQVAYSELNLDPKLNIQSFHMDGRQFVAEKARHGHYHLVTLDAVNDFSVPAHLMTKEFNEEVKKTLTDDGIYLVTVIDFVHEGKLWKAAARTLSQSFAHVEMVFPAGQFTEDDPTQMGRSVIVLYASNQPFSQAKLNQAVQKQTNEPSKTYLVPRPILETMLNRGKKIILTDQYCPVDNLMAEVFMNRNE